MFINIAINEEKVFTPGPQLSIVFGVFVGYP